jgi:hypothetical protein
MNKVVLHLIFAIVGSREQSISNNGFSPSGIDLLLDARLKAHADHKNNM